MEIRIWPRRPEEKGGCIMHGMRHVEREWIEKKLKHVKGETQG